MKRPKLTVRDFFKLRDAWLTDWHRKLSESVEGNAELWLEAVLKTLEARGDQIFTVELRKAEEKILASPFRQDYLDALYTVCGQDVASLILASPDQRIEAIKLAQHNVDPASTAVNFAKGQLRLL